MDWILRNLPYIIGLLLILNVAALAIVIVRGRRKKKASNEMIPMDLAAGSFSSPGDNDRQHAEPLFAGLPLVHSDLGGGPDEGALDGIPVVEPLAVGAVTRAPVPEPSAAGANTAAPPHIPKTQPVLPPEMEDNATMMLNPVPEKSQNSEETGYLKTTLARFTFQDGTESREYIMSNHLINIGRNMQSSDLLINNDNYVGRNHAIVYVKNHKFFLVDLASRNGTWIDGEKLTGQQELPEECEVKLGQTVLHFSVL